MLETYFEFATPEEASEASKQIANLRPYISCFWQVDSWKVNGSPVVLELDFHHLHTDEVRNIAIILGACRVTKEFQQIWP